MCIYEIKDKDCPNKSIWLSVKKKKRLTNQRELLCTFEHKRNSGEVTVLFLTVQPVTTHLPLLVLSPKDTT